MTVFGWTTQKFPFSVKTAHTLKLLEPHVITVTGKAFYDIGHAPADHSNRRSKPEGYAVWELHPVMALQVAQSKRAIDVQSPTCSNEQYARGARLQEALERLTAAIRDVESELASTKAEQDPLASHIFISRRCYRNANDTKSGKRREMIARLSFNSACELGFRGSLDEWERLMGAVARR
jgi:hypothetical protein